MSAPAISSPTERFRPAGGPAGRNGRRAGPGSWHPPVPAAALDTPPQIRFETKSEAAGYELDSSLTEKPELIGWKWQSMNS
eukprot:603911-Hanusia_phi.AAC.1